MQLSVQSFTTNKIFCRYCKRDLSYKSLNIDSQICQECDYLLKNSVQTKNSEIPQIIQRGHRFFIILKSLILGDLTSNKTQLFNNYINSYLNHSYQSTIGLDISGKNFFVNNREIRITVNIISHLDRFKIIRKEFYSGTNIVFLVFNTTDYESIRDVEQTWNSEIVNYQQKTDNPSSITKILVGNNWNFKSERKISERKTALLSDKLNCSGYVLCSNSGEIFKSSIGGAMNNLHDTFLNVVSNYIENYKATST